MAALQQRLAALEAAQPQLVAFDAAHLPDDEPEGWGTPLRQLVRQDVDPDADLPEEAPDWRWGNRRDVTLVTPV